MKPTGSEMPLYPDFLREIQESSKTIIVVCRAVGRSKNPGEGRSDMVGIFCPLVEMGLTDLPKTGTARVRQPWYAYLLQNKFSKSVFQFGPILKK
jgi:hypothetical protein